MQNAANILSDPNFLRSFEKDSGLEPATIMQAFGLQAKINESDDKFLTVVDGNNQFVIPRKNRNNAIDILTSTVFDIEDVLGVRKLTMAQYPKLTGGPKPALPIKQ